MEVPRILGSHRELAGVGADGRKMEVFAFGPDASVTEAGGRERWQLASRELFRIPVDGTTTFEVDAPQSSRRQNKTVG